MFSNLLQSSFQGCKPSNPSKDVDSPTSTREMRPHTKKTDLAYQDIYISQPVYRWWCLFHSVSIINIFIIFHQSVPQSACWYSRELYDREWPSLSQQSQPSARAGHLKQLRTVLFSSESLRLVVCFGQEAFQDHRANLAFVFDDLCWGRLDYDYYTLLYTI